MAIADQISELTPAQAEALQRAIARWRDPAWFTARVRNKDQVGNAVRKLYAELKQPEPKIRWSGSPSGNIACAVKDLRVPRMLLNDSITAFIDEQVVPPLAEAVGTRFAASLRPQLRAMNQQIAQAFEWYASNLERLPSWTRLRWNPIGTADVLAFKEATWGPQDFYWVAPYDFIQREIADKIFHEQARDSLELLLTLAEGGGAYLFFEDSCYISERPTTYDVDEHGRMRESNSAALAFPDGETIFVRGTSVVPVPAWFVNDPASITLKSIQAERNIELRRIMYELYGPARYIQDSRAKKVHEDKFGVLWRQNLKGDEPLMMVEVINSTPEPDGTIKHYFLRVPPHMRTAREAVAWTFGVNAEWYDPLIET